jgi:hypothetical protein
MVKPKAKPLKLPTPTNANQALSPEHTVYVATTGGGKTTAIKRLDMIRKGAQVAFFDPYSNYSGKFKGQQVQAFTEFAPFYAALIAGRKKKAGFKVALNVPATLENFEIFAQLVWSVGNGSNALLHCVCEEMATIMETNQKLNGKAGELWRGGRQFGLVMHALFQRMQEVPKTVTSQSAKWWVGGLAGASDAKAIEREREIDASQLMKLKTARDNGGKAQYIYSERVGEITKQGEIDCRK